MEARLFALFGPRVGASFGPRLGPRLGPRFCAGLALLALAGCGTAGLFGKYDIPESAATAAAPWPRLVDVPEAPPPGSYTPDVPDPAIGQRLQADLGQTATTARARAAALADPVIGADQQAAMRSRARASR